MKNLADNELHASRLKAIRNLMQKDLESIGRPFGEFIPVGTPPLTGK